MRQGPWPACSSPAVSYTHLEAAIAKAGADQERVLAETLSLTRQAEAQRDLEIKKAEYNETVKRQQATADKAYEIQTSVMQQTLSLIHI